MDYDKDYKSQIDILLLSENRIIAYELKGYTAKIIDGTTDNNKWKIKRWKSSKSENVKSFFQQASKHHAFLVSDFLSQYRSNHIHLSESHWIVDARVVLKSESDLSGFFYKFPQTIFKDSFKLEVLDNISSVSDIEFLTQLYSGIEEKTGKLSAINLSQDNYQRANKIFQDNSIPLRTEKWFRLITENQIQLDILQTGSDRFHLNWESAMDIAIQLKNV
ncbi:MAG: nuclease-related domain-containing protein [Spirochaetia bacterium]|nr:nuclease-related domain-containing protein [Spirochaetia bacterium]